MRALIVAVGSRGDVAPFTGLATALNAAGHTAVIAGYEMFAGLVTGCGLEFRALPGDPRMLDAARWQRGGTGPLGAARLIRLIAGHLRDLHAGMLAAARQDADVLLLGGLSYAGGYHIAEGLGLPSMSLQLSPVAPTRDFAPSIVTARPLGRWGNLAAGHALVLLGAPVLAGPVQDLRAELGLPRLSSRQALYGRMSTTGWPVFHGFSPAVVPPPADWGRGAEVVGYWWPARPLGWCPPPELEIFLNAGPAPVFVGFGSMAPADADRVATVATAAARQAGVRLVLQAGRAGLAQPGPAAGSIVIGDVPHDWLFPRMAAVVHHAGAGTTAAGLRAGVPAVCVPMVGDQPFWAARIAALRAGPAPIRFRQLSVPVLAEAIREVLTRPAYRVRAQHVATQLAREDAAAPVIAAVNRLSA